jgi:hypothetical protein
MTKRSGFRVEHVHISGSRRLMLTLVGGFLVGAALMFVSFGGCLLLAAGLKSLGQPGLGNLVGAGGLAFSLIMVAIWFVALVVYLARTSSGGMQAQRHCLKTVAERTGLQLEEMPGRELRDAEYDPPLVERVMRGNAGPVSTWTLHGTYRDRTVEAGSYWERRLPPSTYDNARPIINQRQWVRIRARGPEGLGLQVRRRYVLDQLVGRRDATEMPLNDANFDVMFVIQPLGDDATVQASAVPSFLDDEVRTVMMRFLPDRVRIQSGGVDLEQLEPFEDADRFMGLLELLVYLAERVDDLAHELA